jgi:hypothetical protein
MRKDEDPRITKDDAKNQWVAFDYKEQMELAKTTRNVLLAVLAELSWLYFKAWDRKKPIVFNISALGFSRRIVRKAIRDLEAVGWISVERRKNKAPRVTILKGFHLSIS